MTIRETFKDWYPFINQRILINTLNSLGDVQRLNNLCPPKELVFNAFQKCSYRDCKIILIGQDPYPQEGIATGLCFANKEGSLLSPSLQVIKESFHSPYKNYQIIEFDNTLESWASQGILLLNSALTVERNKPGSHTLLWRSFISSFINKVSETPGLIFMLFGQQAQSFEPYIHKGSYIFKERHPASYARNRELMSSKIFDEVNKKMKEIYGEEIIWFNNLN